MNPYNFVPFGNAAPRRPVTPHHKFDGKSGRLVCRLKTLTPLFVGGLQDRPQNPHEHQRLSFQRGSAWPSIPGSSLKGSIRSVAEALSGSCLILPGDARMRSANRDKLSYWDKGKTHDYFLPDGFSPCGLDRKHAEREACPACRIFGYLFKDEVHLGHLNFSAAQPATDYSFEWMTLEPYGAPAPRHGPFYGTKESSFKEPRGRKFYYHHIAGARITKQQTGQNKTVETVLPGAEFEFAVDYENLQEDELALLIFSLILDEPLRHKIGMGKGVGLGSVQFTIREWQKIDMTQRYTKLNAGKSMITGDELAKALNQQRQPYHELFADWRASFHSLREIWTWDEKHPRHLQYPSFFWFKDFGTMPIEEVPDDAGQYKVRAASTSPRPATRPGDRPVPVAAQDKTAQQILRQTQRQAPSQVATHSIMPYKDRDVEKAKIVKVEENTFEAVLSKLPDQKFAVKKKNLFRSYKVDEAIRVRILVNAKGEITRVEEV